MTQKVNVYTNWRARVFVGSVWILLKETGQAKRDLRLGHDFVLPSAR